MTVTENRYQADLRDFRFVLLEQFRLADLLGHGRFEDWGEEEILSVLQAAYRYATEVAGPLNAVGDREGCTVKEGQVHAPSGFQEAYARLYEGGFKSLTAPPDYGGATAPKSLALLVTELTSGANPALDMYGGLTQGAGELLLELATAEQRERFCPKLYDGSWAGTMCLTEPQAGSDVGESRTRATKNPDGTYSIQGTKIFISGGDHDLTSNIIHLVLARVEGAVSGTKGLSLFIVPKWREDGSSNDVKLGSIEHKMGLNGSATCVLNFGEEGMCRGELVGGIEGQGMRQMFQMMNFARIAVGVQGLACAGASYLSALSYARERKQGARIEEARNPDAPRVPILDHADVRRMLLEMKAKVEGTRAMIVKAGIHRDTADQTEDAKLRAYHLGQVEFLTPLIKAYASDQAFRIAEMAIQVYGGAGYTSDHVVEQYCRDSKVFAIYEGTNHIQALDLVGRKLGQDGGAHAQAFVRDVKAFAGKHESHPRLGGAMQQLTQAVDAVARTALRFAMWGQRAELRRVGLAANGFLECCAEVCVGWVLLDAAVLASAQLESTPADHPDQAFYEGKLHAAEYFAEWILPLVVTRAERLGEAKPSPLEIPDAAFATV